MLAGRFRVFAFDARGHGRSRWPEGPLGDVFSVDRFADDLAAVAGRLRARLGGAALDFAGHSLTAAAALRLAARHGSLPFARTVLFEPPILPPQGHANYAEAVAQQERLAAASARRRAHWPSPRAFGDFIQGRGAFKNFAPGYLDALCRASLKRDPAGGYVLRCPPAVESAIFRNHRDADTWQRLPAIALPLHLVSGDPDLPGRGWVSGAMAEIAGRLSRGELTVLRGVDHLMIQEQPAVCRDLIFAWLTPPHS
jgi:pimeloyl-ACP methyl ester carboxylesterase